MQPPNRAHSRRQRVIVLHENSLNPQIGIGQLAVGFGKEPSVIPKSTREDPNYIRQRGSKNLGHGFFAFVCCESLVRILLE